MVLDSCINVKLPNGNFIKLDDGSLILLGDYADTRCVIIKQASGPYLAIVVLDAPSYPAVYQRFEDVAKAIRDKFEPEDHDNGETPDIKFGLLASHLRPGGKPLQEFRIFSPESKGWAKDRTANPG